MSYQVKADAILAGSLNLMAPGDLLPAEDAVALQNWRADASGALRSRLDRLLFKDYGAGYIHSLFLKQNSPRVHYVGIDTYLYAGDTSVTTDLDGTRIGLVSFLGSTWIMNRAKQGRDYGAGYTAWGLPSPGPLPSLIAVEGGALEPGQQYTYYVTGVNARGEESNPCESTITIAGDDRWVTITKPTLDAQYTTWNVYRTGNTLPDAYRVNPDPIDVGATTFQDSGDSADGRADLDLTRLGIALETDHDAPPAARGLIGPYYGKLIAFSSAAHPNWIWWTKTNMPYAWPGAALAEGSHAPVGEDGDEVVAASMRSRQIRFYKHNSIWRLAGDPDADDSTLDLIAPELGIVGSSVASAGDIDYIECKEGIYACNGFTAMKLSGKLDPLFRDGFSRVAGSLPVRPVNKDAAVRAKNVLEVVNGRLYYSYADDASTTPNTTLVCDLSSGRWAHDARGFTALLNEGQAGDFMAGDESGRIYSLEYTGSGSMQLVYRSGFRDQGTRDRRKTYADVAIEYSVARGTSDQNLTVKADYDYGVAGTPETLGTIPVATAAAGDARARSVFQVNSGDGRQARNVSVQLDGTVTQPVTVYSHTIHYYLEARDALGFDSDEIALGYEGVKSIDEVEVDIDATATVSWALYSDRPGGAQASRATGTIAATGGNRKVVILTLSPAVEGRLVRLALKSAATFRLYGARIRHRRLGMFLDGANGETYITQELRFVA